MSKARVFHADTGQKQKMNDNENRNRTASTDRIVLKQIQMPANRRILHGMKSFNLDTETPDSMKDMLRRLERAESRRARASG